MRSSIDSHSEATHKAEDDEPGDNDCSSVDPKFFWLEFEQVQFLKAAACLEDLAILHCACAEFCSGLTWFDGWVQYIKICSKFKISDSSLDEEEVSGPSDAAPSAHLNPNLTIE